MCKPLRINELHSFIRQMKRYKPYPCLSKLYRIKLVDMQIIILYNFDKLLYSIKKEAKDYEAIIFLVNIEKSILLVIRLKKQFKTLYQNITGTIFVFLEEKLHNTPDLLRKTLKKLIRLRMQMKSLSVMVDAKMR